MTPNKKRTTLLLLFPPFFVVLSSLIFHLGQLVQGAGITGSRALCKTEVNIRATKVVRQYCYRNFYLSTIDNIMGLQEESLAIGWVLVILLQTPAELSAFGTVLKYIIISRFSLELSRHCSAVGENTRDISLNKMIDSCIT